MNIAYDGGNDINIANIIPSSNPAAIKTFTVTGNNTTEVEMNYKISFVVEYNDFSEDALKYKFISTNTDNNGIVAPNINTTNLGTGAKTIELGIGSFGVPTGGNKTHTYRLEIYFPNQAYNQNIDQEKSFGAYLQIENYTPPLGTLLHDTILAQGGGAAAIEAENSPDFTNQSPLSYEIAKYKDIEKQGDMEIDMSTIEGNWMIASDYIFNESCYFTLDNYTLNVTLTNEHVNKYFFPENYYEEGAVTSLFKLKSIFENYITATEIRLSPIYKTTDKGDTGLYAAEDEYGTSYYYRGAVDYLNNNILFGGFQWKIVRINGDGSIRLIYNGTEGQFNQNGTINYGGTNTRIDTAEWNTTYDDDAKYLGYMYGGVNGEPSTERNGETSAAATYNETSSNIKTVIDTWYQNNIAGKSFESQVADNLFCNDRQLQSEVGGPVTGEGFGNPNWGAEYAADYRHYEINNPTLKCGLKNDRFTKSDVNIGNGALTYPVGLLTVDEARMAGLTSYSANETKSNYLDTYYDWWCLSPSVINETTRVFRHDSGGNIIPALVNETMGVRPVISINSDILITGTGTIDDPYKVVAP